MNKIVNRLIYYKKRLRAYLYTNETILVLSRTKSTLIKTRTAVNNLVIKEVDHANVYDAQSFQNNTKIEYYINLLNSNNKGFYAYFNGKVVHANWIQTNGRVSIYSPFIKEDLTKNCIYMHSYKTDEEFRNRGITAYVIGYIINKFSNFDILVSIRDNNIASLKAAQNNGFKVIRKYKIFVLLGIKLIRKL